MYKKKSFESVSIGLAMFSMFFGAGNIIFPLALGQISGDKNLFAMLGLILTAAVMPTLGVIAMILYDGNYRAFFGRLGDWPGFLIALVTISLLGPFGSTPRCIALAYTTFRNSIADISPIAFSASACVLILILSINKKHLLNILGLVLTPLLLVALTMIIALGLWNAPAMETVPQSNMSLFLQGLKEGYNTMDLLAAFFFSSSILHILKARAFTDEAHPHLYLSTAYQASLIGAALLSIVYIGFSYLLAFHGSGFMNIGKDKLLVALTLKIAGPYGGMLVCLTITLACLTTAIALITAFTDFMQKEVLKSISYPVILVVSLLLTFVISTYEFNGISTFLGPILEVCYPGLIALTFFNIAYKLWGFPFVKIPVFAIFTLSLIQYFL